MEYLENCPLCGKQKTHDEYLVTRDTLVTEKLFTLTRCNHCSFIITNPRPFVKEGATYYKSDEYVSHTDSKRSLKELVYRAVKKQMGRRKINWVRKHLARAQQHQHTHKPTLLDYGCGTGDFVLAAKENGFNAFGYDPDPDAMARAKKKGVPAYTTIEQGRLAETKKFDVITMWHVLEHIPNAGEVLASCRNALKDNGIMIIAVPMANSADAIRYKERWAAWDAPRHLYHFVPDTLCELLKKENFVKMGSHILPFDAYYIALLSEQNKKAETPKGYDRSKRSAGPGVYLRALYAGLASNRQARKKKCPASSQAFVFRKSSGS